MYNKATKYLLAGKYEKALQFFKREPAEFKEKYLNMGNAYRKLGQDSLAESCYVRAASHEVPYVEGGYGPYPLALNNLGLLAYSRGDDALALQYYNASLVLDPLYFECIWNYGNALLRRYFSSEVGTAKDWEQGWKMYEYRFKRETGAVSIDSHLIRWDGISNGTSICVVTEQGIGDKIMFGRYLSLVASHFDDVYVLCHPSLDCLFSDYKICRTVAESGAACSIPMCSLAGIFGLVDEKWLEGKFNAIDLSGFNIGVVYSGSSTHANNHNRSCASSYFSKLSSYGNLYSLNPAASPCRGIKPYTGSTWADTASLVLGLDVVVTVDTSIVHLCGTLGVPCIMIQPLRETDFRWGLGFEDTPWYSSVRIVENNGWDLAFVEVRRLLEEMKCTKE
jgi:tetratricopeptide (TPR) repeat protein